MGSYFGIKALYKDTTLIFANEMKLTLNLSTGVSKVVYSYTTKTGATGSGTVTSTTTIPAIFGSTFTFTPTTASGYSMSSYTSSLFIYGDITTNFKATTSSSGGGGGCVTGDMPVLVSLDGTTKAAKSIATGSKIVAYDSEKNEFVETTVRQRYVQNRPVRVFVLHLNDDSELHITAKHRFLTEDGYKSVCDDNDNIQIECESKVIGKDGAKVVVGVSSYITEENSVVYNYQTEKGDCFVANGVIVENESSSTEGTLVQTLSADSVSTQSLTGSDIVKKEF